MKLQQSFNLPRIYQLVYSYADKARSIMKNLILGIGNPILCDDSIGILLTHEIQKRIGNSTDITFEETSVAGVNLLDIMCGYDKVVIIDAVQTGSPVGTIHTYDINKINTQLKNECIHHNLTLFQTIELGKKMNMPMPSSIHIIAIEVEDVTSFTKELTDGLKYKLPEVIEGVMLKIKECEIS